MRINIVFLIIGLVLSIISKILQFKFKLQIGNIIVIPAASFLCLSVMFSIGKFYAFYFDPCTRMKAFILIALALGGVLSFQLMAMSLVNKKFLIGISLAIPFAACLIAFLKIWLKTF